MSLLLFLCLMGYLAGAAGYGAYIYKELRQMAKVMRLPRDYDFYSVLVTALLCVLWLPLVMVRLGVLAFERKKTT